jgi:hypothetical protein
MGSRNETVTTIASWSTKHPHFAFWEPGLNERSNALSSLFHQ